ncbi:MAG: hypothetical protein QM758_06165 [Armatimonas sp.]
MVAHRATVARTASFAKVKGTMFRSSNRSSFLQGLRNAPRTTRRTAIVTALAALAATAAIAAVGTLSLTVDPMPTPYPFSTPGTSDTFSYTWTADWNGSGYTADSPVIQIEYLDSSSNLVLAVSLGAFLGGYYTSPGYYGGGPGTGVNAKGYVNTSLPPPYRSSVTQARYRYHADIGASDSTGSLNDVANSPWRTVPYPWP